LMRDERAFEAGHNWLHVLGVSTTEWAVTLSAVQRILNKDNPDLRVSFDSSSPFQDAGRYERVVLTPEFSSNISSWVFRYVPAQQSILYVGAGGAIPFEHIQSPLGKRLMLNHLNINGGEWSRRQFDSLSNTLLANHNTWVYLDAILTANDLVLAQDSARVPSEILDRLGVIEDAFERESWRTFLSKNASLLGRIA
jgi:hypothetical protein